MEHTKTISDHLPSFGLKQKIRKMTVTMGMLLVGFGLKAQTPEETCTRFGEGALALACLSIDVYNNTAFGYRTLIMNNCASNNTGIGAEAMGGAINEGSYNSVLGYKALYNNTSGHNNDACGVYSLYSNTSGFKNVASGARALYNNTTGNQNVAFGASGLWTNTTGSGNTSIGINALFFNNSGSNNTALGMSSGTNSGGLSNTTTIGYAATVSISNKIRLGNSTVTMVEGPVSYTVSDGRFKTNISESDVKGLEFIKKLRPVVYNFDTKKLDDFLNKNTPESVRKEMPEQDFSVSTAIRQSGFIAQEVEVAAKEAGYNFNGLHVPENDNDNYSIAYGQFVVPLVKAVQELSKQNEEQKLLNDVLKKELIELKAMIKNNSSGTSNSIETSETILFQNSPNPFDQVTTIRYSISPLAKKAMLTIVSINGEKVKEFDLTGNNQNTVAIHAGELAPGNYVYSLVVDDKKIDSKKMTLTK